MECPMRWLRFSIAGLMAIIVYAALGLAAFANVDDPWYGRVLDDAYFMATVFILATATVLAVIRRGEIQAIWVGFAIFGWAHLNYGWPDSGGPPQRAAITTSAGRRDLSAPVPPADDGLLVAVGLRGGERREEPAEAGLHMA